MICKLDSSIGDLEIDYFKKTDIDAQLDYLYNSPKEFLEGIGFDLSKLPGREKHRAMALKRFTSHADSPREVVARYNGETVACVYLDERGESPKAHFHIYSPDLRGKGVGPIIFKEALRILMSDHNVKELTVEPMVTNVPMNKMLQKCGFKNLGRSIYKGATTQDFESFKYLVDLLSLS